MDCVTVKSDSEFEKPYKYTVIQALTLPTLMFNMQNIRCSKPVLSQSLSDFNDIYFSTVTKITWTHVCSQNI